MIETKKDCFAYDAKRRECKALNHVYCKNSECKFYKKKKEKRTTG